MGSKPPHFMDGELTVIVLEISFEKGNYNRNLSKSSFGIRIKLFDTVPGDRPCRRESNCDVYFYDLIIDPGTIAEFFLKKREFFNLINIPGIRFQIFFILMGKQVVYCFHSRK